jgi:penicillin-binding protein 1C
MKTIFKKTRKYIFKNRWRKFFFLLFIVPVILFFILSVMFPLRVKVDYSQIVTAGDGTVIHAFLTKDEKWRMMLEQNEISPQLRKAILYKEDKWFYYHFGVNPFAIGRAAFNNLFHLRRTSGASTITMQVVRLLYPKERTYGNKIVEVFRATQLELTYSKEEILQLYFNLVPYGGNVEGVKAASLLYFGRMPDKLSLAQITTLAIIPNRPISLKPGKRNDAIVQARNKWLRRMKADETFNLRDLEDALNEPLDAQRQDAPKFAPHFAVRMKQMYPSRPIIKTSLNRFAQDKITAIAYNYSKRLKSLNINNAAVLVINNKTGKVEAYLGSPDATDNFHNGQVDGITAIRSPGSTLKPLVYALAFDKGLATPKTVIADVPVNFDGYAPENFNSKFNGNVTVEKALSYSLNIPAVKMLNQLGTATLTDKLKQAGFKQIMKDENKLGLSTVLGGCGVSLEELTSLYAAFAHEGKFSRLKFLKEDSVINEIRLISPGSAFMTSEILTTLTRPDLPNNFQSSMHIPKIAWKTGTSYGRHDAWSIGYNMNYTIGVWIGNFSGEGVPELTGADMATPLLFEIFNSLDYNSNKKWFRQPDDLDFRLVCSVSGKVPDDFCESQVIDYFIPKVSSVQKCNHMKQVYVSPDESFSYCTSCLPHDGYKTKLYSNPDPDLITYYETEHILYEKIPAHNKNCSRIFSSQPPTITSPTDRKEYIIEKGQDQQLMLSCNADNEVKTVYWYINDRFFKSCSSTEKIFFVPEEGQVKISCSDDKGRNTNIVIKVSNL